MCGIVCVLRKHDSLVDRSEVEAMLCLLTHRGPDDSGIFLEKSVAIGMTRLSILDLTSPGLCPYVHTAPGDPESRAVISWNGEIFNYREVRVELEGAGYTFDTTGDTEVLLKAYIHWGPKCLDKLNGMYALIIADLEHDSLFIARDIAGEKPIYFCETEKEFIFASEIKSILQRIGVPEINITEEYLAFEYMTGAETMFKNIYSLLPAHCMTINGIRENYCSSRIESYWNIASRVYHVPPDTAVDILDELLNDAVSIRLRSDVPWGLYLSGGIDSALLAYIARPKIVFSVVFFEGDNYNELRYAELVARDINAEHVIIQPSKEDFEKHLDTILYHLDVPVGSFSAFPLFALAQEASRHVKVVLSGEGADELFSGYTRYLLPYRDQCAYEIPELERYETLLDYYYKTPIDRAARLLNRGSVSDETVRSVIAPHFSQFNDIRHSLGYTEFKLMLVTLLQMEDRMTSAFGMENRSPFLDKRIIEFAFSIPGDLKIKGNTTKYIVKEVAKRYIPNEISARREKLGLIAPINLWFNFQGSRGEFDRAAYNQLCRERWKKVFYDEQWFNRRPKPEKHTPSMNY